MTSETSPPAVAGTVAVALLLLLAGCSGLGGDGEPDRPAFDVPPTTEGGGEETDPFPYGVNESGVTSSFALLQAHVGVLRLESFRVVRERTVSSENGTVLRSTRVDGRVAADRLGYRLDVERLADGNLRRQSVYASVEGTGDGGRVQGDVFAVTLGEDGVRSATRLVPRYGDTVAPRQVLAGNPSYRPQLYRYLTAIENATVRRVDDGGTTTVRIRATETAPDVLVANGTVSELSVQLVIDERGVVTETTATYAVNRGDSTVRVVERIVYSEIGTTSVTAPPWYDGVRDRVTATAAPGPGLIDVAGNRTAG